MSRSSYILVIISKQFKKSVHLLSKSVLKCIRIKDSHEYRGKEPSTSRLATRRTLVAGEGLAFYSVKAVAAIPWTAFAAAVASAMAAATQVIPSGKCQIQGNARA